MLSSKLNLILSVGLVVYCSPIFGQTKEAPQSSWNETEEVVSTLLDQKKFDEALTMIELAAQKLPGREFEISNLTLTVLFDAGRTDEALSVWEKGLEEGFFYFVVPQFGIYDGVRRNERFKKNLALNNHLREIANSASRPEYKVIKPVPYSPSETYPLVIIIHGGNQSIAKAIDRWNPAVIGTDVIIAYVQSSQRADTKSYRWDLGGIDIYSLPRAQDEILGLYREIIQEFAVDTRQVTLAGFSQGGNLALFMAAEGTIPASGFIAGCPAARTPVSLETARDAAARGVRGTIFVGTTDWTAATAQTTVSNFQEAGVPINHIVMEGKGHEFPDDFDEVLRQAITQIHQASVPLVVED